MIVIPRYLQFLSAFRVYGTSKDYDCGILWSQKMRNFGFFRCEIVDLLSRLFLSSSHKSIIFAKFRLCFLKTWLAINAQKIKTQCAREYWISDLWSFHVSMKLPEFLSKCLFLSCIICANMEKRQRSLKTILQV